MKYESGIEPKDSTESSYTYRNLTEKSEEISSLLLFQFPWVFVYFESEDCNACVCCGGGGVKGNA